VKACGVAVAMLLGRSWESPWPIDFLVNVGTISGQDLHEPQEGTPFR